MIDFYEQINYDDLTPDIRLIADVCGIEAVREILKNLNGLQFYIPKVTSFERFVYRYINDNNHKTIKEIARELDVTEYYLKTVIKRNIQV